MPFLELLHFKQIVCKKRLLLTRELRKRTLLISSFCKCWASLLFVAPDTSRFISSFTCKLVELPRCSTTLNTGTGFSPARPQPLRVLERVFWLLSDRCEDWIGALSNVCRWVIGCTRQHSNAL